MPRLLTSQRHHISRWAFWYHHIQAYIDVYLPSSHQCLWSGLYPNHPLFLPMCGQYSDMVQQQLEEDPRTNRIEDSLQLFTDICSSKLLRNASLILLLNKVNFGHAFFCIIRCLWPAGWSAQEETAERQKSQKIVRELWCLFSSINRYCFLH